MKALMLIADGFDEIEAFTIIDVLRRADLSLDTVSLEANLVTSKHRVKMQADRKISEIDPYAYDMLILPGGQKLLNSSVTKELIKNFNKKNKFIAAISTSSIALAEAGVLDDKIATVFPGFENRIPKPRDAKVVVAKNVITSRGPGTAIDFSIKLAQVLSGKKNTGKLRRSLAVENYAQ